MYTENPAGRNRKWHENKAHRSDSHKGDAKWKWEGVVLGTAGLCQLQGREKGNKSMSQCIPYFLLVLLLAPAHSSSAIPPWPD